MSLNCNMNWEELNRLILCLIHFCLYCEVVLIVGPISHCELFEYNP